ncbi:Vacuolar protein sorting-associated protein 2-like protein 3 [Triticum urartu]|uniref:Vacuolar protein sorting-associated protein 2-like protein 3 n=2 Tax=Triticum urartu TaxID=4572 RepID=M7YNX0_TRIUA|nr:Vacuolar protein sorting-associated protein 2-like protein 3 [Triticum urartu]
MRQPHALFRWASYARCCCWLSLVRFPVVACVEPWVRLSFSLSLLLLSLALLLLVGPAAYPTFCLLPRIYHGGKICLTVHFRRAHTSDGTRLASWWNQTLESLRLLLLCSFGQEAIRNSKRELTNATRGIERDIGTLQQEEKRLVAEIKRTAKTGNEAATKILARQLIRLRQKISTLQGSRAQIRGIATHTQAMQANTSVSAGMQSASKAMGAMNKQMDPAKQMKVMQEFQKQSAQMDMTNEMMSDSIDNVLDDDQAEDETEELANQVLDEIGVDVASQLSPAPKGRIAGKKVQADESSELEELKQRLAALKNP